MIVSVFRAIFHKSLRGELVGVAPSVVGKGASQKKRYGIYLDIP